jgi:dephospho-CoA kinase
MPSADLQSWVKRKCIGLTGGVATGKSTVAAILRDMGYVVLDADQIARVVVEPGRPAYREIIDTFGASVVTPEKTIDRKKLGALVWSDPDKKAQLEAITHPRIKEEFGRQSEAEKDRIGNNYFFYEATLLFEVKRDQEFFKILCTWCSEDVQLQRLAARNQLSDTEAHQIMSSQMDATTKRDKSDLVIDTACNQAELIMRVSELIHSLPH